MKKIPSMILMATALTAATTVGIGATVTTTPSLMAPGDYLALKRAITIEIADLQLACGSIRGPDSHICRAENVASERVMLAELEARYKGTFRASREAVLARIASRFDVQRSKCILLTGFQRDNCVVAAHAEKSRALMTVKAEGSA
jgi:hypothetical protein